MKGSLAAKRVFAQKREATGAAGSDKFLPEIDCGSAQNGMLILEVTPASSSDLANVQVWTSNVSDFGTSGTQLTTVASDGTKQISITSDANGLWAATDGESDLTTSLTVSSSLISAVSETGVYVVNVKDCGKYLKVQYDSDGTGSYVSQVFVGEDLMEAPHAAARTAY